MDTIKEVKRKPTEWENIFANHISDKGFVSRIFKFKELLQFNKDILQFNNKIIITWLKYG